jgi:hypothetical protein
MIKAARIPAKIRPMPKKGSQSLLPPPGSVASAAGVAVGWVSAVSPSVSGAASGSVSISISVPGTAVASPAPMSDGSCRDRHGGGGGGRAGLTGCRWRRCGAGRRRHRLRRQGGRDGRWCGRAARWRWWRCIGWWLRDRRIRWRRRWRWLRRCIGRLRHGRVGSRSRRRREGGK